MSETLSDLVEAMVEVLDRERSFLVAKSSHCSSEIYATRSYDGRSSQQDPPPHAGANFAPYSVPKRRSGVRSIRHVSVRN